MPKTWFIKKLDKYKKITCVQINTISLEKVRNPSEKVHNTTFAVTIICGGKRLIDPCKNNYLALIINHFIGLWYMRIEPQNVSLQIKDNFFMYSEHLLLNLLYLIVAIYQHLLLIFCFIF